MTSEKEFRKCPKCSEAFIHYAVLSGNTFGGHYWSDSKIDAPMLPDEPRIACCSSCKSYFWMEESPSIDGRNLLKVKELSPLFFQDYLAILTVFKLKPDEEFYVRLQMWWSYNDYVRYNNMDKITENMVEANNENMLVLLNLLDPDYDREVMMAAEIHRQLGDFEQSRILLDELMKETLLPFKNKQLELLQENNTEVAMLG